MGSGPTDKDLNTKTPKLLDAL